MVKRLREWFGRWIRALARSMFLRRILAVAVGAVLVISPAFDATTGFVQTLALLCYILLMVLQRRVWRMAPLRVVIFFACAMLLLLARNPELALVADGFLTIALAELVAFLVSLAADRFGWSSPSFARTGDNVRRYQNLRLKIASWRFAQRSAGDESSFQANVPQTAFVVAIGLSLAAAFVCAFLGPSWHMTGSGIGASLWNAHYLSAGLEHVGARLADRSIVTQAGGAAFVAVPDTPLFDIVKLVYPGPLGGVVLVNLVSVLCVWAFLIGATLFLETWLPNRYACAGAAILFLLQPLGFGMRIAAPFDLVVPIFVVVAAMRYKLSQNALISAALLSAVFNVAAGYELALLTALLWAFGYLRNGRLAASIAGAAALSSIAFAAGIHALAPATSLREAWWSSGELPRMFWAESLGVSYLGVALVVAATVAGIVRMVRARAMRALGLCSALFCVSAVLAIPAQLGGVQLLLPTHILDGILPLGWPTARFFELAVFALAIPMTFAVAAFVALVGRARRPRVAHAALGYLVAALLFLALVPRAVPTAVPSTVAATGTVIFPIAEAGSPGSFIEANALLQNGSRILQPIPFVDGSPFEQGEPPASPATIAKLHRFGARTAIVLYFLYAKPSALSAGPRLFDPRDFIEPDLQSNPNFQIEQVTEDTEVYGIKS